MPMQKTINITVNSGGKPLWPFEVVQEIQGVMEEGELNHGHGSWKNVSVDEHLERAYRHILMGVDKDDTEDHLTHAFTRLMMAVALDRGYAEKEGE